MHSAAIHRLQSALDELADAPLGTAGEGPLGDELVALMRLRHRLDAQIARRAAQWDRRQEWSADGSRSAAARLSRDAAVGRATAGRLLRHGRSAADMPEAAQAWAAGELSADHFDLLSEARGCGRGELFSRDEHLLVRQCSELRYTQAARAVRYWCQRADTELHRDGSEQPPCELRLSTTFNGAVVGTFTLGALDGEVVSESLRRIERELYHADQRDGRTRSQAERMAAALVEMARRAHATPAGAQLPEPLLYILAGEASLEHILELGNGRVIEPGLVVPLLDRLMVETFVFEGADRVIAASPMRTFRGMLRRAIQVRDRHCQHPSGCDVPLTSCDVDHIRPHRAGGITEERNGRLQCPAHNRRSDLHDKAPPAVAEEARHRRRLEELARARVQRLIAERHPDRAPPPAAA